MPRGTFSLKVYVIEQFMSNNPMAPPKISIIIVSWNVRALLQANLERLFSLSCKYSFEVFVVDNGSHDGSAKMVRELFPAVHLITNDWDAGFAGPNNQALRLVKGDVVLLLNPDMLVEDGALDVTYETLMADRSIGVLGVRLVGQDGKPIKNVRRYPDFFSQLVILLKLGHLFPHLLRSYMCEDFNYAKTQDVDQVRGSFFAFRRELLDTVGTLDAGFHIWFEEVDYCRRVKLAGLRVVYLADVAARDYVGRGMAQMKHFEKQLIFSASMIRYFKKYHPWWQTAVLVAARPIGLIGALIADGFVAIGKPLTRV